MSKRKHEEMVDLLLGNYTCPVSLRLFVNAVNVKGKAYNVRTPYTTTGDRG